MTSHDVKVKLSSFGKPNANALRRRQPINFGYQYLPCKGSIRIYRLDMSDSANAKAARKALRQARLEFLTTNRVGEPFKFRKVVGEVHQANLSAMLRGGTEGVICAVSNPDSNQYSKNTIHMRYVMILHHLS
jgi:hypothetical protein